MVTTQNGKTFSFPTFGCEDCQRRKEQLLAGDWKMDAAILALVLLLIFMFYKVKIS